MASSSKQSDLLPRLASAAILIPIALFCTWYGGYAFLGLVVLCASLISWEWSSLKAFSNSAVIALLASGFVAVILISSPFTGNLLPFYVSGICAVFSLISRFLKSKLAWSFGGAALALCFGASLLYLRQLEPAGVLLIAYLAVCVWASDTCAYFVGRAIGGKKLWPSVSPNKTWSGAFGGILGAALAGALYCNFTFAGSFLGFFVLSAGLSVAAQAGDLSESALKRYFNVKDTSALIPGHGGVLDRMDGFIVATLCLVILTLFSKDIFNFSLTSLKWWQVF